ncbi:MAG: hypothetical protein H6872_11845 [Methylobacteriaceae bacterium]|nr:hypothetical protein [Rhodoblastus sp.]MCC0005792.1 hypothetical protein [Methylobacteriaceae bacterium]
MMEAATLSGPTPLDLVDFGELPEATNALLQEGVLAYRCNPDLAREKFERALEEAPAQLPVHFCLYKIHTYQGRLDEALASAQLGLCEAARQAGWPADWRRWRRPQDAQQPAARFALYTLKALAFIRLKRDERAQTAEILEALRQLDPAGHVGWPVVAALADGCSA